MTDHASKLGPGARSARETTSLSMTEPDGGADTAPSPELLITRIASMAQSLRGLDSRGDRTFASIVSTAATQTVALVPGVDHAAVAVIAVDRRNTEEQDLTFATDAVAAELTALQLRPDRGPAPRTPRDVTVTDLTDSADRALADAAARLGVQAMMTMPLFVGDRSIGLLTAYADDATALDDDAVAAGAAIATHVALAALSLGDDASLRTALSSRDVIGQAKGILMERYAIDGVAAFELLARLSQQDNRRLIEIAADVVDTRRTTDTSADGVSDASV